MGNFPNCAGLISIIAPVSSMQDLREYLRSSIAPDLIERKRWPLRSSADDKRFARQLVDTLEMPGQSFVQVLDKSSQELKKRARQLGNAAIYTAGNHKSA